MTNTDAIDRVRFEDDTPMAEVSRRMRANDATVWEDLADYFGRHPEPDRKLSLRLDLERYRLAAGLNFLELEEATSVRASTLSAHWYDAGKFTFDELAALMDVLKIPASEIRSEG